MSQSLFTSLYDRGEPFALIDTRERRDHVNGHWFGSTHVPLSLLKQKIARLVPDYNHPLYLLDWQDKASDIAAQQLSRMGYRNLIRSKTTPPESFGAGFVKGEFVWSKAFGEVVAHTCGLLEVTPEEYLAHHKTARLFDVRPTAEYTQFTIPGSQSLPNSLLLANMNRLEQSGEMALLHCAGRTRSIIGACTLKAAGYQGQFAIFKGGTQAWQLDGHEREFDAARLFATETDNLASVEDFLNKWCIHYETVDNKNLNSFIASNRQALLFDVSDDAATGELADHRIIRISGTNLVQQTDRSIACYHVPVILFDHGSGSRAAFAAYWLTSMGFSVSVVFLNEHLADFSPDNQYKKSDNDYTVLSTAQLIEQRDAAGTIFDFRPSLEYSREHLRGSLWANISDLLVRDVATSADSIVIGRDISHARDTADLLISGGWKVAGSYAWTGNDIDQNQLQTATLELPVDQCALFAGRHHGNMQDSRDYLAWEEELPEQIDESILKRWNQLLGRPAH